MEEVFDQIEKFGKDEKRVAMATLVATRGTSPKKEGAKMWVSEQGRILGSVTIGGCVDAQVIEESEKALASFESRLLSVTLGEEDAWEGGFTCAGTIQVMIEPLDLYDPEDRLIALYRLIHDEVKNGKRVVVATRMENTRRAIVRRAGRGRARPRGARDGAQTQGPGRRHLGHGFISDRSFLRDARPRARLDHLRGRPGCDAFGVSGQGVGAKKCGN
jgi:xanthine/CO dehydrogenase XdhC/CoxF family maturation factor